MPLTGLSADLIKSVTTIDRSIKIDEISVNAYKSQRGNKYTSKKLNYFVEEEYIYISTPVNIKAITITALFEDPIQASRFKGLCDCEDCDDCIDYLGSEFPIDNDLLDTLVEMCFNELVIMFNQSVQDLTNNSNDTIKGQNK